MEWLFPRERARKRGAKRMFRTRLTQLIDQDQIYTTDDLAGAAIWALPGRWHVSGRETLELVRIVFGPRLPILFSGLQRVDGAHPRNPEHFYLAVLGIDPPRQGQGIGSALIAPVLELCDRDRLPAYLESSKERNVDFYARHGFRVRSELRLPKGPPMWPMWRSPH
jgi:GNAT superfamily N-acetyltransferase